MATYFVDSARADDTGSGLTWALAKKTIAAALAAASTDGDIVVVKSTVDHTLAADTTFTFAASINLISATADDASTAYTPTAMGTTNFIGSSATNYSITFAGTDKKCFVYGVTLRNGGTSGDQIYLSSGTGQHVEYENCYFWLGTTSSSAGGAYFSLSGVTSAFCLTRNCTFRFGATGQIISVGGWSEMVGCSISADGSAPTTLFSAQFTMSRVLMTGCDLSMVTGTLVGNAGLIGNYTFERCKFGSGVTVLAAQTTNPTKGAQTVSVFDCHSGDTHMEFGYYDALGEVTKNSTLYFTSGAAAASWKIVTSANTKPNVPFITPWIDLYNTATSAITPRFEILRDGSATAYQNDEVWAEFTAKTTANVTLATAYNDRNAVSAAAADQAAGAGTGSWTGENATAWSGKCDSGAALTPSEVGYIRGRICVAEPSITVYVNPEILTA